MQDAPGNGFRGWRMVGIGFATQALAVGVSFGSFPVFLPEIVREFDASVMEVSAGMSLLMFTSTLAGVVVGGWLDRRSIRAVMAAGAGLQAVCLLLMSRVSELWQLGVLFGLGIALGIAMLGPLASATLAAKWFQASLGRAQGITNMGGPAGVATFAALGAPLIATLGWRDTLLVYAGVMALAIPAVLVVVRSRPQDLGQWPDGASEAPAEASQAAAPPGFAALLRNRQLWLLVLPVGLLMGLATGWGSQVVNLGLDLGMEHTTASAFFAGSALLGIVGTVGFGTLADRVSGRTLLWVLLGVHALGFAGLAMLPASGMFQGVVPLLGLLGGGMMPVYAALIGRLFGAAAFGQVMGLGGLLMAPIGAMAPALGGFLRDATGSYAAMLLCFAAGMLLAAGLLQGLREPRPS